MTLAELITALEAEDPRKVVPHGFAHPHSYRGDYMDLAFEPASNVTVADMLTAARSALGTTYQGWKGGDYEMSEYTDCWLSMEGSTSGETIGPLLLKLMLAGGAAPEEPRQIDARLLRTAARAADLWALENVNVPMSDAARVRGVVREAVMHLIEQGLLIVPDDLPERLDKPISMRRVGTP